MRIFANSQSASNVVTSRRSAGALRLVWGVTAGLALTVSSTANAQSASTAATSDGKGIAGGILLGAETVMLIEAAAGVKPWWAYLVGGLAGGAAGGAGGYFVETLDEPRVPMAMLIVGLGLVIPTTISVIGAVSYTPSDYTQDTGRQASLRPPQFAARRQASGLVGLSYRKSRRDGAQTQLALSIPSVEVKPVFTRQQRAELGVDSATEVRMPLLSASF